MNKKGSVVGVIGYIVFVFVWVILWGLLIDPMDYLLDDTMNETWEAMGINSSNSWVQNYATYRDFNFKQFIFWGVLIGITISYMAYSYNLKVQERYR
jgi:hypothetical protein